MNNNRYFKRNYFQRIRYRVPSTLLFLEKTMLLLQTNLFKIGSFKAVFAQHQKC